MPESIYSLPGDIRPAMGISIWTQYVLDNFATVREAVDELKKETFRIDAPRMPNGGPESTLHMAITDETGNTAVLEYLDGKLSIHEGKEYQVMTNSPRYEYQLAINDYWKEVGGLQMLPGTSCINLSLRQRQFLYTGFRAKVYLFQIKPKQIRRQCGFKIIDLILLVGDGTPTGRRNMRFLRRMFLVSTLPSGIFLMKFGHSFNAFPENIQ